MTINSPAAIIFAFYLAAAKKKGADFKNLRGTLQNDILKEYIAQKNIFFRQILRCGLSGYDRVCVKEFRNGIRFRSAVIYTGSRIDGRSGACIHSCGRFAYIEASCNGVWILTNSPQEYLSF